MCCGDLTLEQFQTLKLVNLSDLSSIGSLSTELRVDLSTMSRNVALLERNGYLLRTRSAEDGRVVHVRLSSRGKRILSTLCCGERDVLGHVYDRIPPSERLVVIKALEVLKAGLENLASSASSAAACCPPTAARKRAL